MSAVHVPACLPTLRASAGLVWTCVNTYIGVGSPVGLAGLGGTAGGGEGPVPDPGIRLDAPPAPPGANFLPSVLGDMPPPFISHGFSGVAMISTHARLRLE